MTAPLACGDDTPGGGGDAGSNGEGGPSWSATYELRGTGPSVRLTRIEHAGEGTVSDQLRLELPSGDPESCSRPGEPDNRFIELEEDEAGTRGTFSTEGQCTTFNPIGLIDVTISGSFSTIQTFAL